jgi:DNA-nicking Smr family endonuclease
VIPRATVKPKRNHKTAPLAVSLQDLGGLKKALQDAARIAAEHAAAAREKAERERRERHLFTLSVGFVEPLKKPAINPLPSPRPSVLPRQRELDEASVLVEAISDDFDVESLLETDDTLSFRRDGIGPEVTRKLRRGVWAIQAALDLHGLRRDEAREHLAEFLRDAERGGLRCVRVIHGKGNGSPGREPVLKGKVRNWLVQKEEVIAFVQARASEGGHGALVVLLRPSANQT